MLLVVAAVVVVVVGTSRESHVRTVKGWEEGEQGPEVKEVIVKRPEVKKSDRPLARCA